MDSTSRFPTVPFDVPVNPDAVSAIRFLIRYRFRITPGVSLQPWRLIGIGHIEVAEYGHCIVRIKVVAVVSYDVVRVVDRITSQDSLDVQSNVIR